MNLSRKIHETAMEFFVLGDISRAKGQNKVSAEAYDLAFELERKAALQLKVTDPDPLWRWILLRSAASIANKAKRFEEGKKLIKIALSENPPEWLKEELSDISQSIDENSLAAIKPSSLSIKGIITDSDMLKNEITIYNKKNNYPVRVLSKFDEIVSEYFQKKVVMKVRKMADGLLVLEKISLAA